MRFGKKGTESQMWPVDTEMWWLILCIALGVVAIFFVFIISKAGAEQAKINENLEALNLMKRFFESPNCFAYDRGGIASGVIDAEKFNEERLSSCYKINENLFPAFRITLISESAKISKSIKTKNWNENREAEEKKSPRDVLIYSGGKINNGAMLIEIQNLQ